MMEEDPVQSVRLTDAPIPRRSWGGGFGWCVGVGMEEGVEMGSVR